jgi:hypothetical protein
MYGGRSDRAVMVVLFDGDERKPAALFPRKQRFDPLFDHEWLNALRRLTPKDQAQPVAQISCQKNKARLPV